MCSKEGVRVPLIFPCKGEIEGNLCLLSGRHDCKVSVVSSTSGSWREQTQDREFVRLYIKRWDRLWGRS